MIYGGKRTKGIIKNNSKDKILFSIITIVFNGDKTIEKTINSVFNQTYDNIEYIIIDGGSTDKTLEILKKNQDKIDYWVSEPDKGISDAFNKGISLCKGEIIGIINADDWYEENTCKLIANNYSSDICVYYGDCNVYYGGKVLYRGISNIKKINKKMSIYHPSVFIKATCYDELGNFNIDCKISMDYDLILRFWKSGKRFFYIREVLSYFTLGGVSSINKIKGAKEKLKIKNKYLSNRKIRNMLEFYVLIVLLYIYLVKKKIKLLN